MKNFITLICVLALTYVSHAQEKIKTAYPNIGDTLSNYTFTDLVNSSTKTVSIEDYRGKWLILDFWGYSCGGCLASFPKMDSLQEKFKDKMKLIMVGAIKYPGFNTKKIEKITKDVYRRLDQKYHLKFTVAFDSVLNHTYDVGSVPQILVIDPKGVIKAKTYLINEQQLSSLIKGEPTQFVRSYSRSEPLKRYTYKENLPFLTNGVAANGGNDTSYLFRSLLKVSDDSMPPAKIVRFKGNRRTTFENGRLEVFYYSLLNLYQLAYLGMDSWEIWEEDFYERYATKLYLNLKDSTDYKLLNKKQYSYSLSVPKNKSTPEFLMKVMQSDLENYFGFKAKVIKKMLPVYYFEVDNEDLFKRKILNAHYNGNYGDSYGSFIAKNISLTDFMKNLSIMMNLDLPTFNHTGLNPKINVEFVANRLDGDDLQKKLSNYGLKLVKGVKELEVIELNQN
ncbi:hypothetical protein DBR11_00040 [Pedobacter sp. HMWF019]|uniref:redoxin domain-containing protein n=1 Tax=Pedobacter sp. HMWF019 TaxID=2056856 RepID=UPI000D33C552|nr:redoxin domain-containing protein [Pedobacter sp. HMWF019]PTT04257.1 hypothetical protein DBR11_00040 [Pedobacter sp. HMWF019]